MFVMYRGLSDCADEPVDQSLKCSHGRKAGVVFKDMALSELIN